MVVLSGGGWWDHPRSRGVYVSDALAAASRWGSSPLARGLHQSRSRRGRRLGIIPARAGFTGSFGSCGSLGSDHPRSRGVYGWPTGMGMAVPGSSPLARGLPVVAVGEQARRGIIPARAGFTWRGTRRPAGTGDHPRSRGVYKPCPPTTTTSKGSSPLARGLLLPVLDSTVGGGSSPLARGLPRGEGGGRCSVGIIPARAGFTLPGRILRFTPVDHPRSRGVYALSNPRPSSPSGSSPLARGLQDTCHTTHKLTRIIPARAGFTNQI